MRVSAISSSYGSRNLGKTNPHHIAKLDNKGDSISFNGIKNIYRVVGTAFGACWGISGALAGYRLGNKLGEILEDNTSDNTPDNIDDFIADHDPYIYP